MAKTEAQMDRLDAELSALDDALATLNYLGYSPRTDTWKSYLFRLGCELDRTLTKRCR